MSRIIALLPYRDPVFWLSIGAGFLFWAVLFSLTAPHGQSDWLFDQPFTFLRIAVLYPIVEEIIFRGGIQTVLLRLVPAIRGPISLANVLTSLVFALSHLFMHPPLWAAGVFIPSLIFGYFRDKTGGLATPIALHLFYNVGYFWLFGHTS